MRTFSGKQMRPKWTCVTSYSKGHDILKRHMLPPFHTTSSPRSLTVTTTSPIPARPLNPVLLSIPFPLAPVIPIVNNALARFLRPDRFMPFTLITPFPDRSLRVVVIVPQSLAPVVPIVDGLHRPRYRCLFLVRFLLPLS